MTAFHHLYESSNHGVVHVKTLPKMEQSRTKTSTDLAKQIRWACKCLYLRDLLLVMLPFCVQELLTNLLYESMIFLIAVRLFY